MTATATENVLNMAETEVIVNVVRDGYKRVHTLDFMHDYEDAGHNVTIFDMANKSIRHASVPYEQWNDSEMQATTDEEVLEEYKEHSSNVRCVKRWMNDIDNVAHKAYDIGHGRTVEVFKGRKVPKGIYEVTKYGNGNYGFYVNLRDRDGKFYNFVSEDNVRVIPQESDIKQALKNESPNSKLGEALWDFVFSKITNLKSWAHYETELLVMCDYIEDGNCGDDVAVLAPILRAEITRKTP
jgi:hypothetical protein